MNKCYLFSYGTLQIPEIQKLVLGRELRGSYNNILHGYKLEQLVIDGTAYSCAISCIGTNNMIYGRMLEITDNDLSQLDEFETDAYKRVEARCMGADGSIVYMYVKNG